MAYFGKEGRRNPDSSVRYFLYGLQAKIVLLNWGPDDEAFQDGFLLQNRLEDPQTLHQQLADRRHDIGCVKHRQLPPPCQRGKQVVLYYILRS